MRDPGDSRDAPESRTIRDYLEDRRTLAPEAFRARHGGAFLVQAGSAAALRRPLRPQRTLVGETLEPAGPPAPVGGPLPDSLVLALRRTERSPFRQFLSVGRTRNNDVVIADVSVSKFHAFFNEEEGGALTLQDAGSRNGTFLNGAPVPPRGQGPAVRVESGEQIRFGDIAFLFYELPDFLDLLVRAAASSGRGVVEP